MLYSVKNQIGSFHAIGKAALQNLKLCPNSPRLWYLAIRYAEVFGFTSPEYGDSKQLAIKAAAHAPNSVSIITVLARLDGSLTTAQRAYKLSPSYPPARRVYALALAREGKFKQALQLLPAANAESLDEDEITHARILLAMNQPQKAVNIAQRVLQHPGQYDTTEPTITDIIWRDGNEVLGFALLALKHNKAAFKALQAAADAGSQAARDELAKH